ncbi:hypothetical protein CH63R_07651 [Colletotrichum higginsianum IMI 349063]|uniref:Uncharacterized protein n=3 Tax=Colletotrichum destructivum species complex TaxID=2707350 RepID=A0A1B7YA04_COLHI|nr:hypothetical protein CH63R_07651 [Colletotrichum higginsianum IMI 349063]OBR08886.1 hypothetical protein CH63R_07651 [Colletotrichum higginsianum IMI 349063]
MNGSQQAQEPAAQQPLQPPAVDADAGAGAGVGANGNSMTAKKRKKDGLKPIITTETPPPVLACKVQQQQVQSESSPVSRHSERPVSAQHRATQLVSAERCDRARRDYVMAAAKENRRNPAKTICLFDNDKTEKMNRQDGWGRCCGIDTRWASVAWMGCTTAVTQGSHWPEMGIFLACKTWARRTRAARTPTQFTGHPLSPLPATSTTGTAETAASHLLGPQCAAR